MGLESFTKQPYEEFVIEGDFVNVLGDTENIVEGNSTITAVVKSTGVDATSTVLDTANKAVSGSKLQVPCKAGDDKTTYKITFRAETDTTPPNKWEIDCIMRIKEL